MKRRSRAQTPFVLKAVIALFAVQLATTACAEQEKAEDTGTKVTKEEKAQAATKSPEVAWLTDFEKAKAASKETGKPILANFSGSDWCGWCIKLDEEVFERKAFKAFAADKLILFNADFPRGKEVPEEMKKQNEALAEKYEIRGLPTVLLLNAEGKVLTQTGYREGGPEAYVAHLTEEMSKADKTVASSEDAPTTKTADSHGAWLTDFEKAQAKAEKTGRPMLVNFSGSDWCGWCIRLDKEVLEKKEFKTFADENLVLVNLDFPRGKEQPEGLKAQNRKLMEKYGVQGFPTVLVLDAQGEVIGRTGYQDGGPEKYVEHLKEILRKAPASGKKAG